ncbi:MAG TPA: hypothetical protein VJ831_14545 [Jatrophihabitantaceae bacterium]|nr:hypothetical protein [Jatrophihabitantaceae bacterium]
MVAARVRVACAATTAALLLAACGSGSPSDGGSIFTVPSSITVTTPGSSSPTTSGAGTAAGTGSGTIDPSKVNLCRLVSKAEAEHAAAGAPMGAGKNTVTTEASIGLVGSCAYRASDSKAHSGTAVTVVILGTTVTQAAFEKQIKSKAPEARPLAGLGDGAFTIPGIVFTFYQGLVLSLQVSVNATPADPATIVPLARLALKRTSFLR